MYGLLRVLVLSDWFPDGADDAAGSFVRHQALAIARCHAVVVLHLRCPTRPGGRPRLETERDGPLRVIRLSGGRPTATTVLNLYAVAAVMSVLRRERAMPDLLHAHEMGAGLVAAVAGHLLRRPVVISEHSSEFSLNQIHGVAARVARLAFAGADVVCPVSQSLRASLEQGGWGGHLRVVPNVVDTELFTPPPHPPSDKPVRIVAVAALEPVKGVEELVEAVALLRSRRTDFRVELIGAGSLGAALSRRVATLGLEEQLVLRGPLRHSAIAELMRGAAFAVVPSRWDTFSVVMSEAMACGLPVVATAVGGIPERIHSGNGMLCPSRNPKALAATLELMLDRYPGYDRNAIAREVRSQLSAESVAQQWDEVYAEAFERRGHQRPVSSC